MKHWQTTTAGVLTILAALAGAGVQYLTGHPVAWPAIMGALATGVGLMRGADSSVVDQAAKDK